MHAWQSVVSYEQRNPAATQLYKVISENLNSFLAERSEEGRNLPKFIVREFESHLRCGIFAQEFGRVQCGCCQHEKLVPYSCMGRGYCPSSGARRMAEAAIHLTGSAACSCETICRHLSRSIAPVDGAFKITLCKGV